MTDKQIINEIDISKCEFCHSGEYCYIYSGTASFKWICEENEDCQIKNLLLQLKRKEQELNDYKKQFKADTKEMEDYQNEIVRHLESIEYWQHQAELGVDTTNRLTKELEEKEQECEELKDKLKTKARGWANVNDQILKEVNQLKAENDKLQDIANKLLDEKNKYLDKWSINLIYKQTLTKIKKIAEETINSSDCYKRMYGGMCARPILQKISECEV